MSPFAPSNFFDLSRTEHPDIFSGVENGWDIIPLIQDYLARRLIPENRATLVGNPIIGERVFLGEGTTVEPGAYIKGPAWIGANVQIRHGAYIRENVIVGGGSVVGNSCEIKNSFLFAEAQVAHFNYLGDSILGCKAHLGAGVIVSNLKLQGDEITVRHQGQSYLTGLRKFGAMIGDEAEVGCNTVLNPGTILGRRALVYPGIAWRGVLPENTVAKSLNSLYDRR